MTTFSKTRAFSRFGLGARIGDLKLLGEPKAALLAELENAGAGALEAIDLPDGVALYAAVREGQMEKRTARKAAVDAEALLQARREIDPALMAKGMLEAEAQERFRAVKRASIGYVERLVAFWTNHFALETGGSDIVRGLAGAFEREAIRPRVLGKFGDMALAVTQHPAMLTYLNNAVSVGPQSRLGQRRSKGLNENHARELMELHTLGVDGGYGQGDVTALANVLTGWSIGTQIDKPDSYGRFQFKRESHEPGAQTVLGKAYDQPGLEQGKAVLADLVASGATARHVVTKFVRHFVADVPDTELVERMVGVFTSTGGDLKALATALVQDDAAWAGEAGKLRTPQEFVWAAIRALDLKPVPRPLMRTLADLGQPIWNPPSPAGYKDDVATWLAPDAMTNRLDAAELMAAKAQGPDDPRAFAEAILGDALSPATARAIAQAESRTQGLALMLMSPEFLRR